MQNRGKKALRLLKLTVAASVLVPLMLFGYAALIGYQSATRVADERLLNHLNVVQEHALKVLETIERALAEADEVVDGWSEADLARNEKMLHERLKKIAGGLPHVQSMAIIGADGRARAISLVSPPPPTALGQRDYFVALSKADTGTYIGQVLPPVMGARPYFNVARRRQTSGGVFDGVILASVLPSYFDDFYSRIATANDAGTTTTLLRDDGTVLVRFPASSQMPSPPVLPMMGIIRTQTAEGEFVGKSALDGEQRRGVYRRLAPYPVYVLTSVAESAVRASWLGNLSSHLIFGLPATLLLIGISLLALRQTQALDAEIEARERAEGALRQAQRLEAIGQLTGGIAHDFNNLLMVVMGGVDRLRRSLVDPKQLRTLDMIMASAQRGESLIRHLLTFSRRQAISPESVDLTRFLLQMEEVLRGSLKSDIALEVHVPVDGCVALVDPGELELALLNLAVNARDAMPEGGRLTLTVAAMTLRGEAAYDGLAGEFVALSVADSGEGIAAENQARVFEPFFTTKPAGQGTGLGLSQVYGFAKQLGGTVAIVSAPGQGTTVTLLFPRGQGAVVAAPQQAERTRARILLVEDEAEVAQISRDYLERMGHGVEVATNGVDAVTALQNDAGFDLVVSDIVMPGAMDGLAVARHVRAAYPQIPIILVTGFSASADAARNEGFEVLRKPFNIERITQAVDQHLARSAALAANG